MKKTKINFLIPNIVYVLALALVVRIALSSFGTLRLDQGTFIAWSINLAENGFKNFYKGWSDYLPGYLYVLYILGKIRSLNIIPEVVLYKLPAIISDLAVGFLIYKIIRKIKDANLAILGSIIFLFNPAIIANSTLWGQVDSLTSLFSLLSIYLLPTNLILSAVFLSVGTLVKPQAAFILPVIIFLFFKNRFRFSDMAKYSFISFIVFVAGFVPFSDKLNIFQFTFERVITSLNQYQYTSVNAFNFWGTFGFWKPENIFFQSFGYLVVIIGFVFLLTKIKGKENAWVYLTSYIFASSFLFFTRMHERHLLPVFAPLAIGVSLESFLAIPYIGFSVIYLLNLFYSYKWITENFNTIFDPFLLKLIISVNIFSLVSMVLILIDRDKVNKLILNLKLFFNKGRKTILKPNFVQKDLTDNKTKIILILILAFVFLTRVYRLSLPKTDYFDEIYHAFTARLVLHSDAKAWEWWNPHHEGFAYEWTHPPLSKLTMALSMKVFGENSFGWRFSQVLAGTISVYVLFLLAKEIFKDNKIALLSSLIFSLDGLFLVLSRMGMNDVYVLLFSLLAILFFLRDKDSLSAISLGLAFASKWSAIWVIPILFVIYLRRNFVKGKFKFHFRFSYLWFILLPFVVYLLTYTQMFTTGHGLDIWWGMQKQMWWYHTNLRATHPYTSMWWSWPFMIRPVYLYTSEEINGIVSRIYAIGNPFVFWFGALSVAVGAMYAYMEKNKRLGLVVFSYLIFFVPWVISPRIMFLYHYLPSIPFMCMATAYILRRHPKLIFAYLLICVSAFIYFYSHWAGLPVPLWLDQSYYWFTSWR